MNAFIKTEQGLFKVYRQGDEWQVLGPKFERWFSIWSSDVIGSLHRALDSVPGDDRQTEIIGLN
jgi:hypothetical protein